MSPAAWTFMKLFSQEAFSAVQIPILQRDYAQGRLSEKDVRTFFLDKLHETLIKKPEEWERPLDLDFVYGSIVKDEAPVFTPLDGQQRLTTLFLLHWYLACKAGHLEKFQRALGKDEASRFTYKVRKSSRDFFSCLINEPFSLENLRQPETHLPNQPERGPIWTTLMDQRWFFLAWQLDPTIDSALRMLDAIHDKFEHTQGCYENLFSTDPPYVTFQFLRLDKYGLSDDLYLKMNARGKQLSTFEVFKANLKQKIAEWFTGETRPFKKKQIPVGEYFGHKMDTNWLDLFWHHQPPGTNELDRGIMNFVRGMVRVRDPRSLDEEGQRLLEEALQKLADFNVKFTVARFIDYRCLTKQFVEDLMDILDRLYAYPGQDEESEKVGQALYLTNCPYFDEQELFEDIIHPNQGEVNKPRVTQERWIEFCAFAHYILKHGPQANSEHFRGWMRVVCNLVRNSELGGYKEFPSFVEETHRLLESVDKQPLIPYLAKASHKIQRFSQPQVREEHFKARLMDKYPKWVPLIEEAELHGYFQGQIEFLFAFCEIPRECLRDDAEIRWDEKQDREYRQRFRRYYDKVCLFFNDEGVIEKPKEYLLARALLCVDGRYLPRRGRNRRHIPDRAADFTWKRFLRASGKDDVDLYQKREAFKLLLDQFNEDDPVRFLRRTIKAFKKPALNGQDSWRYLLAHHPAAIAYCKKGQIRFMGGDRAPVYLVSGVRLSGSHAELQTHFIYFKKSLGKKIASGEFPPFEQPAYMDVHGVARKPHIRLVVPKHDLYLEIEFTGTSYRLTMRSADEDLPPRVSRAMRKERRFKVGDDGALFKEVNPGALLRRLRKIGAMLQKL